MPASGPKIKITENGPYIVSGDLSLQEEFIEVDKNGDPIRYKKGKVHPKKASYALCRCGHTKTPPYCDGSHSGIKFDGQETASRKKYLEQAKTIKGPKLSLKDQFSLCAVARFCHRGGGTWRLTEESADPKAKELAIEEANLCPAGRLVALEGKEECEWKLKPSLSLIQDPQKQVSGPIWVKGKVSLESSDGTTYEKRNRVTLCRCGQSANKPYCDGSHIDCGFQDKK